MIALLWTLHTWCAIWYGSGEINRCSDDGWMWTSATVALPD